MKDSFNAVWNSALDAIDWTADLVARHKRKALLVMVVLAMWGALS